MFDNDRKVSDYDNQQNNDETTNYKVILGDVFHGGILMEALESIRVTVNRAKKEIEQR